MAEVEMKGVATRVRKLRNDTYSFILAGKEGKFHIISKQKVGEGDITVVNGTESGSSIFATSITSKPTDIEELRAMFDEAEKSVKLSNVQPLIENEIINAMWEDIKTMAKKIKVASMFNRQTLLRFHGDADGVVSAMCISSIINAHKLQQNIVTYTPRDALGDLASLKEAFMPLVIFVDFGSGYESLEGIKILTSGGVDLLIIDHHPPTEEVKSLASFAINPWFVKPVSEASKLTAGYLSFEISRLLGIDNRSILGASIAGDKSDIIEISNEDKNNALVLDYLTTFSAYGNNLDFYASVLRDKSLYNTILNQARESLEYVRQQASNAAKKKQIGDISVYLLPVDKVVRKTDFPSRGKIASQLYETVKGKPAVVLAFSETSVIFRIADEAFSRGIKANVIIDKLKQMYPNIVISGGGHSKAASIRFIKGNHKFIIEEILHIIRSTITSQE